MIGNIAVQYGINLWNRALFNALQQCGQTFAYRAIMIFLDQMFA